jgi:hypothetical protein
MSKDLPETGYSADVRMELRLNGHVLKVGQLGPSFLILSEPVNHPPAEAELMLSIDNRERRWKVFLPNGIDVATPRTKIE